MTIYLKSSRSTPCTVEVEGGRFSLPLAGTRFVPGIAIDGGRVGGAPTPDGTDARELSSPFPCADTGDTRVAWDDIAGDVLP